METPRDDYDVISSEGGIPAEVAHRLRPDEARALAYLVTHRDRAVSPQELCLATLGGEMRDVRKKLEGVLFMISMTILNHGKVTNVPTHYRGKFAFGMQWESTGGPDAGELLGAAK